MWLSFLYQNKKYLYQLDVLIIIFKCLKLYYTLPLFRNKINFFLVKKFLDQINEKRRIQERERIDSQKVSWILFSKNYIFNHISETC